MPHPPCVPDASLVAILEFFETRPITYLPEGVHLVPIADRRIVPERRSAWRGGRRHGDWICGAGRWLVAAAVRSPEWQNGDRPDPTWGAHIIALNLYAQRSWR